VARTRIRTACRRTRHCRRCAPSLRTRPLARSLRRTRRIWATALAAALPRQSRRGHRGADRARRLVDGAECAVIFWCFRVHGGLGLFFILLFATAFYLGTRHRFEHSRWFLRIACFSLPLPWIAAELGWVWPNTAPALGIDGVLPTFLGVSRTPVGTSSHRWPAS